MPRFIIASDVTPQSSVWALASSQVEEIRAACAGVLGFDPDVRLARMEEFPIEAGEEALVIPAALDFNICQREALGRLIGEARRRYRDAVIHHDDVDPGHPLVVGAFADQVGRALEIARVPPQRCGLVLAASGRSR